MAQTGQTHFFRKRLRPYEGAEGTSRNNGKLSMGKEKIVPFIINRESQFVPIGIFRQTVLPNRTLSRKNSNV